MGCVRVTLLIPDCHSVLEGESVPVGVILLWPGKEVVNILVLEIQQKIREYLYKTWENLFLVSCETAGRFLLTTPEVTWVL